MSPSPAQVVSACLVEKDGLFLLVKDAKAGGKYNLPSGRVEPDELVTDAAIRETKEETGFEVELSGLVGFYQSVYEDTNLGGPVFLASIAGGELETSDEHPEVLWVDYEQVDDLEARGELRFRFIQQVLGDFKRRGIYPLDVISAIDYRDSASNASDD